MTSAPRRRWFQWSRQTLFVMVTAVCCFLAFELNWIRQRHEVMSRAWVEPWGGFTPTPRSAPNLLWLFGEFGCSRVCLEFETDFDRDSTPGLSFRRCSLTPAEEDEVRLARRLFPEADQVFGITLAPGHYASGDDTELAISASRATGPIVRMRRADR